MATHLLDDVQQVCDHVVMIDAGRLVIAGATESLLQRTGRVTIDVGPHGDELVTGLFAAELVAAWVDGFVEVEIGDDDDLDRVRRRRGLPWPSAVSPDDATDLAR